MSRPFISLSHSSMLSLLCPLSWYLRYVLNDQPEVSSIPALIGMECHSLIAEQVAHLARVKARSDYDRLTEIVTARCEKLPPYIGEPVAKVMALFATFRLNRKVKAHHCETLLAVDRDFNPVEIEWDKPAHRAVNLTRDCITGQLDYVADFGRRCEIWDWKSGLEFVEPDSAEFNPQLLLYAAIWFAHHPECNYIDVVLWGIKFGEQNKASWRIKRDYAIELARKRTERSFDVVDIIFGLPEGVLPPAMPRCARTCGYCVSAARCPLNIEMAQFMAANGPLDIPRRKPLATLLKEARLAA